MGNLCVSHEERCDAAIQKELEEAQANESNLKKILVLGPKGSGKRSMFKTLSRIQMDRHRLRSSYGSIGDFNGYELLNDEHSGIMIYEGELKYGKRCKYYISDYNKNLQKYLHYFESFTAWMFVADLSCYEMTMHPEDKDCLIYGYIEEIDGIDMDHVPDDVILLIIRFCDLSDNGKAMKSQLKMYEDVINHAYGWGVAQLLFLNKSDLFRDKIDSKPLKQCNAWKDFTSSSGRSRDYRRDIKDAQDYFRKRFRNCYHPKRYEMREPYIWVTCAVDRDKVKRDFRDIEQLLIPNPNRYHPKGLI